MDVVIGQGPARQTCLDAVATFFEGVERVPDGLEAWIRDPIGGFLAEGIGAGCVLEGIALPEAHPVLVHLGAGLGAAMQASRGRRFLIANARQADGFAFGQTLLRPDTQTRRPHSFPSDHAHGVGRALWFVAAGDAEQLRRLARHASSDVWRGIGTAATFTGGAPLEPLLQRAPEHAVAMLTGRSDVRRYLSPTAP